MIVFIMLGEGIVLLYLLGLLVKKIVVVILLVFNGIVWGDGEVVYVIFLLVISKIDYEEVMVIYDLFVIFVCECLMSCLLSS